MMLDLIDRFNAKLLFSAFHDSNNLIPIKTAMRCM